MRKTNARRANTRPAVVAKSVNAFQKGLNGFETLEPRRLLTGNGNEQAVTPPIDVAAVIGYRENPDGATTRTHITWTDNNVSENGYRVEYSPDGVNNWAVIGADLPVNSTSATHVLDAGQKYYYRVRAMQWPYASEPSAVVTPMTPLDRVVQVSAKPVQGGVQLSWPLDPDAVSYQVFRKRRNDAQWTRLTPSPLPATSTGLYDNIGRANPYEYKVERITHKFYISADGTSYGYVYAAKSAPLTESRGRTLLVVDQTKATALNPEIQRLTRDLIGDGWLVDQLNVARDNGDAHLAASVRAQIQQRYLASPGGLQSIFIIGHVPVPYSGTNDWDSHADHVGAWSSDLYYGEALGNPSSGALWTDSTTTINTLNPDNNNLPNDGKFDQNMLPENVTTPVGRVDFANTPGMGWSYSPTIYDQNLLETRLLQRYLDKDHAWRMGETRVESRALIDDHFGNSYAENGWRNFAPLVGAQNTYARDWETNLHDNSYLWSYGAAPGTTENAQNVTGNTIFHIPTTQYQVAFSMLYGSYFGDWNKTADLMREFIATRGAALTCAWAGTPNWFIHGMGLGETIGQGLLSTANNGGNGTYLPASVGMRGTQIGLMGDPTLRMSIVQPVSDLAAARLPSGSARLTWSPANDTIAGYYVYRATTANGPFTRITATLLPPSLTGLDQFTDTSLAGQSAGATYMVRAIKVQSTASGSYDNASTGQLVDVPAMSISDQDLNPPNLRSAPTSPTANRPMFPAFGTQPITWGSATKQSSLRTVVDEVASL